MNIWRIYSAAKAHKYVIALCIVVTTAAAIIASLFLPRFYVGTAVLLPSERAIRRHVPGPSDAPETGVEAATRDTLLADLVVLARSRAIAERVAPISGLRPRTVMSMIDVDLVSRPGGGATDLLRVTARAKNAAAAISVANAWADEFIKFYDEVSHREATETRKFLDDLTGKAKRQLDQAKTDLAAYKKQQSITDLPTEVTASVSELTPLRTERNEMQARLADIGARIAVRRLQVQTQSPTRRVRSEEPPTATIEALRRSIADSKAELIKLSQTYTSDYFRVRELKQQIAASESELARQLQRSDTVMRVVDDPSYAKAVADINDLRAEADAGRARLQRLDVLIAERQTKLGGLGDTALQLADRQRAYDEAEKRYTALLEHAHSARINERISTETGAIKLIDPAQNADGPMHVGPSGAQLIPAAILVGMMLGLGVAMAVESMDRRIKTPGDASSLLELPITGIIPSIPPVGSLSLSPALVTQNAPMSPFAESYRFLATEILLQAPARNIRSVMVATAKPGQGGTSTICNLAITLAQAGRRVVLVDADLRRPSLHELFGVGNEYGLAQLLGNGSAAARALKSTLVDNLLLLTGGEGVANPWALFRSARMPQVLEELQRQADFVLVDTPSAIVFADAATLASVVDGVIVVVRANEAPRGTELQIKELLNHANANILGVVLNDVPSSNVDSCHFYDHYYSRPARPEIAMRDDGLREPKEITWSVDGNRRGKDS